MNLQNPADIVTSYPLHDRSFISITGAQAREFLDGLVTCSLPSVDNQKAAFGALLTPQGKIISDFFILAYADRYILDCPTSQAAVLLKKLRMFKLRADVVLEDITADFSCIAVAKSEIAENAAYLVVDDPRLATLGIRIYGAREQIGNMTADGSAAYHDQCVKLGVPSIDNGFGPEEKFLMDVNFDALNGVSYSKGCFVGQEVTSRMKRKGAVRKRTLILSGIPEMAATDDDVIVDGSSVGKILTVRGAHALAMIRIDRISNASNTISGQVRDQELTISVPAYLS